MITRRFEVILSITAADMKKCGNAEIADRNQLIFVDVEIALKIAI